MHLGRVRDRFVERRFDVFDGSGKSRGLCLVWADANRDDVLKISTFRVGFVENFKNILVGITSREFETTWLIVQYDVR